MFGLYLALMPWTGRVGDSAASLPRHRSPSFLTRRLPSPMLRSDFPPPNRRVPDLGGVGLIPVASQRPELHQPPPAPPAARSPTCPAAAQYTTASLSCSRGRLPRRLCLVLYFGQTTVLYFGYCVLDSQPHIV